MVLRKQATPKILSLRYLLISAFFFVTPLMPFRSLSRDYKGKGPAAAISIRHALISELKFNPLPRLSIYLLARSPRRGVGIPPPGRRARSYKRPSLRPGCV